MPAPRRSPLARLDHPRAHRLPRSRMAVRSSLPVNNPEFARSVSGETSDKTVRSTETEFFAPFLRVLSSRYPSGTVHRIVTAATPIGENRLQLLQWAVRNDTEAEALA